MLYITAAVSYTGTVREEGQSKSVRRELGLFSPMSGDACVVLAGNERGADLHDYTAFSRQPVLHYSLHHTRTRDDYRKMREATHRQTHTHTYKHLRPDIKAHTNTVHQSNSI